MAEPHAQAVPLTEPPQTGLSFTGPLKVKVCDRLHNDWERLADYFAIPQHRRAAFSLGRGPQGIWEWLEEQNNLYALPTALEAIGRKDLLPLFIA